MRSVIVSDLHSNDSAVRTVLSFVQRKRFDQMVCLGDFVGYGAEPNQILDRMRTVRTSKLYIRGNHDRVVAGIDDGAEFNQVARTAALWTRGQLSKANAHFLKKLPEGPVQDEMGVLFCHGSPVDEDEYLFTEYDAREISMQRRPPRSCSSGTRIFQLSSVSRGRERSRFD